MKHPKISREGSSSCRCSTTSHGDQETTRWNASQMLNSFLYLQEDLEKDNGHLLVLVLKRSGTVSVKTVHKVNGTKWAEKMMLTFEENGHPIFRATSPLSRGQLKSKGGGKLSIHHCANQDTITTIFSHNYFCKSAQSLRSSRICVKNTKFAM